MTSHRARPVLAGVLGLLLVAACGRAAQQPAQQPARQPAPFGGARPVPTVAVGQPATGAPGVPGPARSGPRRGAAPPRPLAVLHRWDRRRSRAYATGSVAALRDLYVAGSGAAAVDAGLLRGYRARGYRVRGMRTQLLAVTVLAHRPGRWRLRVTDRLVGATAVRDGRPTALPRDRASTSVLQLVRGKDRRWRVAWVRRP